ncbi:hypothetical protein ABT174_34575, partial [Streptomyces sparsogenes]|uniref:hypothetical protein n=1 Tax=Streptomyces sparsogenes TaxID=67365 RepID=UPI003319DAE5
MVRAMAEHGFLTGHPTAAEGVTDGTDTARGGGPDPIRVTTGRTYASGPQRLARGRIKVPSLRRSSTPRRTSARGCAAGLRGGTARRPGIGLPRPQAAV